MALKVLSVRINTELMAMLDQVCDTEQDPYAPARARIVERGVELALKELEQRRDS